jgi:predicted O-methyltransferase YrrM
VTGEERWRAVDAYFDGLLLPPDPALDAARQASADAGLPAHEVAPNQGKLLHLLARLQQARTILEIGTLGGISTIWLARALEPHGRLVTLESDPHHAAVAEANIARAGLSDRVDLHVGPALDTLSRLTRPFDMTFIDADKRSNPEYLEHAITLSRPGSLIVADNVVRGGAVADEASDDPAVRGVRRFTEMLGADPRLEATAVQTVGAKGHDGFVLAIVI